MIASQNILYIVHPAHTSTEIYYPSESFLSNLKDAAFNHFTLLVSVQGEVLTITPPKEMLGM